MNVRLKADSSQVGEVEAAQEAIYPGVGQLLVRWPLGLRWENPNDLEIVEA